VLLAEDAGGGNPLLNFLPIILIIVLAYFLFIRPNNKRRQQALEMRSRMAPGDEVQTIGGLFGTVVSIDDTSVTIEPTPGVPLRFAKDAIARVITETPAEEEPAEDEEDESAEAVDESDDDAGDAKSRKK
jgi:preprotein translocase subunit YajC